MRALIMTVLILSFARVIAAGNVAIWLKSEHSKIVFGDGQDTWLHRWAPGAIASNGAFVTKRLILYKTVGETGKEITVTIELTNDGSLSIDGVNWRQEQKSLKTTVNALKKDSDLKDSEHSKEIESLKATVIALENAATLKDAEHAKERNAMDAKFASMDATITSLRTSAALKDVEHADERKSMNATITSLQTDVFVLNATLHKVHLYLVILF